MPADEETQLTERGPRDSPPDSRQSAEVPERIGRYRVDGTIGQGGMGQVFAAWDERLDRPVAIKVLPDARSNDGSARARFWREARALATLDHPGIVRVFDFGETDDGALYLVMERVFGAPLTAHHPRLETVADAMRALATIADALASAHAAGIVHRDLKPTNLLISELGATKVIDFGIARALADTDPTLTATGAAIGSPAYMSPEQVRGEPIGPASDVFSLGIVVFELLAGRRPFASPTPYATAIQIAHANRPSLFALRPDLPHDVAALVERMLAPEPDHRPADAAALAADVALLALDGLEPLPLGAAAQHAGQTTLNPTASGASGPSVTLGTPSAATRAPGVIARPARRARWLVASVLVAALVVVAAWWLRASNPTERPAEPPAIADGASEVLAWPGRPPRPLIALEVRGDADDASRLADVVEYAARVRLDGAPDAWLVLASDASDALWQRSLRSPEPRDTALRLDARVLVDVRRVPDGVAARLSVAFADGTEAEPVALPPAPNALAMADAVAETTRDLLGATAPLAPHATRSEDAIAALVNARGDWSIGTEDRSALVRLAVDRDPLFGDALLERAEMLRTDRTLAAISDVVQPGIGAATTPERTRYLLRGIDAIGQDDPTAAYRAFATVLERWRFDRIAIYLTIALTHHGGPSDPAADGRLALRLLEVDPTDEVAISRYIRSGQWASPEALRETLTGLGVYEALGENRTAIDAEFGLATGDFAGAAERFGHLLEANPSSVYALHQQAAAWILAGNCTDAIASLYAWIDAQEARGHGGNLGWSYSLAFQALVCEQQWDAALRVLDRWDRYQPNHHEIAENRRLVEWASREDHASLADALVATVDAQPSLTVQSVTLLHLIALTEQRPAALRRLADRARHDSLDLDLRRDVQRGLAEVAGRLNAFATLHESPCASDALDALRDGRRDAKDDLTERESHYRVDGWYAYARALDRCGQHDRAREAYRWVVDAGYARLYRTVLYAAARTRLDALDAADDEPNDTP
jgi:eukaryotic-like serine/threonine-protein kinase